MWRAFVADHNATAAISLSVRLPLQQHRHTPGQQGNFAFLPRHDIRQIVDRAGQVGQGFFYLVHGFASKDWTRARQSPRLPPRAPSARPRGT